MEYAIGYAATASMTITAGAQSIQPSRRSDRAPSESSARGPLSCDLAACAPAANWLRSLTAAHRQSIRCRHGINPFDCSASLICVLSDAKVLGGLMLRGGDTACEIAIDTL